MSPIADHPGHSRSVTEGNRALELFTDRHEAIRRFCDYLNDDSPPGKILFLHGDGGNGKSLLLKFLRQNACKHFDKENWQWLREKDDNELIETLREPETQSLQIPFAHLDFSAPPSSAEGDYKDSLDALFALQRQLVKHRLRFHLFNFAVLMYLKKLGLSVKEQIRKLPTEEGDLVAALESAMEHTSTGKLGLAFVKMLDKYTGEKIQRYIQRRQLDPDTADAITRQSPEDLYRELPKLFAADLNASMADNGRVVLLFDSHEAFWGVNDRQLSDDLYFARDEWLRQLLCHLAHERGVVAAIAGREPPRWADAAICPIPAQYTELHPIGSFKHEDADLYLQRAKVEDTALRAAIMAQCVVPDEGYHPLYLGLCVDIVVAAANYGQPLTAEAFRDTPKAGAQAKRLLNRLLRYVNQEVASAVRALAACRSFNFEVFRDLGQRLDFQATRAAFNILTGFSFVRRSGDGKQTQFRIHSLIRRVLRDLEHEETQKAHEALEAHYRKKAKQGDESAIVEAIYHANRIRPAESIVEWSEQFDQALNTSRYAVCAWLLEVRGEMVIETDFQQALMAQFAGDYYQTLSRHNSAQTSYGDAIAAYEAALLRMPDYIDTLNSKGTVLAKLGKLQSALSQHQNALNSYQAAITAYDAALQRAPGYISALNNKGLTLQSLGDLQTVLSQYEGAMISYCGAITSYDTILRCVPNGISALNNKGLALQCLGELQAILRQYPDALSSYCDAIAVYDIALRHAPDNIDALNNKGNALAKLGVLQVALSQNFGALRSYRDAIIAYDAALQHAPDHINALNNKRNALAELGDLQAALIQHKGALISYREAIHIYHTALQHAPDYINALSNKGAALKSLGNLQTVLNQYQDALISYQEAINAYDAALQHAPDDIQILNNKGSALQSLGELQIQNQKPSAACQSWETAL